MRTDQILASPAFDFLVDIDPDSAHIIEELTFLAANKSLDDQQKEIFADFRKLVKEIDAIRRGQTTTERTAGQMAELMERKLIDDLERKLLG